jgi:multimeric flavodoxin WrbA
VDADRFVIASRIVWGGYSGRIKGYVDRIIPLSHPYFRKVNGEMHHVHRYPSSAAIFAAGYGALDSSEESTFRDYVASNRDQSSAARAGAVCILDEKAPDSYVAWLEREVLA